MVKFNSAGRALVCAVEMQRAFDTHNRRADEPLKIRLGISVGEATEEDGDYFGDPVIDLLPDEILVDHVTQHGTALARWIPA